MPGKLLLLGLPACLLPARPPARLAPCLPTCLPAASPPDLRPAACLQRLTAHTDVTGDLITQVWRGALGSLGACQAPGAELTVKPWQQCSAALCRTALMLT